MFWEPIESRYRKEQRMFHSSAFAIAAGVVGVAAAGTSAAISMSASDRAAKASSGQGKKYQKVLKAATSQFISKQEQLKNEIQAIDPNLNIPKYDLKGATLESIDAANAITENTLKNIQGITGASPTEVIQNALGQVQGWQSRLENQYARIEGAYPQVERAGQIVSQMAEGDLTQRQRRQLAQVNAELVGATYNPAAARRTAGFQVGQAQLLEATRQASEERQRIGLQLMPSITQQRVQLAGQAANLGEAARGWQNTTMAWMNLANSWQQPVTQMMGIGLQGRGQDINVAQSEIANRMRQAEMIGNINTGMYSALTGQAQQVYQVGQQNVENTLAARQAVASGVSDIGQATSGALMGMGSAYSQLAQAQGGSITGAGGQQFVKKTSATGGEFYAPQSGTFYGR